MASRSRHRQRFARCVRAKWERTLSIEDFMFVPTHTGCLTVTVLPGLYSQRGVGWAMSPR
ncbi:MAG: hypothetical protein ABI604_11435 [Nitrospirota bacterium]